MKQHYLYIFNDQNTLVSTDIETKAKQWAVGQVIERKNDN